MAQNNSINNKSSQITIDAPNLGDNDSFVQFDINTTSKFRIGVDDNDSDAFKISQGSSLGTNDTFVSTRFGHITKPLQPAFLAIVSTQIDNITGNGTVYQVQWNTEVFDQNSDWDGNDTFSAPVDGRYMFQVSVTFGSVSSGTNGYVEVDTSNRSYTGRTLGINTVQNVNNEISLFFSIFCDMDASDTATINVMIDGIGADTADIITGGITTPYSWISGCLAT